MKPEDEKIRILQNTESALNELLSIHRTKTIA